MRPYPHYARPKDFVDIPQLVARFRDASKAELDAGASVVSLAGRVTRIRESSRKLWFVDVAQDQAQTQLVLSHRAFGDAAAFEQCKAELSRGHIIEAEGPVTRTLAGELSVRVQRMRVLAPCTINLPDSELDTENRVRHRHLDMLTRPGFIDVLKTRSLVIGRIRACLERHGFIEVETPCLSSRYGGASARPFETGHISDLLLYLRIAPELSLKQLLVGGLGRVYELGKVFRNEGFDASHNPEFTSCEFYRAFANAEDMMQLTEEMLRSAAAGVSPIFDGGFGRIEIVPALEEALQLRLPLGEDDGTARAVLSKHSSIVRPEMSLAKMYDELIGHHLEAGCGAPTFLVGHPMALSPLAKAREGSPWVADRFELFVGGAEIANGFSEQNDPEAQLEAFRKQALGRSLGDPEAQPLDEEFVQVLRAGLAPSGGCGIGVDRLVMLLTGKRHIRDVLAYPITRPVLQGQVEPVPLSTNKYTSR